MKTFISTVCRPVAALFAALTLTIVCGASSAARAQVLPFVDCVERVDNSNYRAYYGYVSLNATTIEIPAGTASNFFSPIEEISGHPATFAPGVHHRVVAVTLPNATNETWVLGQNLVTARAQTLLPCNDAGGNTRTITYQGKLTDANATANGQYDLRFQIFDAASGGAAKSAAIALENVPVTSGIFTAPLDFGILPALLDGGNLFLEIGVRAGTSTGDYATLTPRQPLTATPYAIRAQSAANADLLGGVNSEGFVRKAGDGSTAQTITGNLTVTGTINGTITSANNAAQLGGVAATNYLTTANANQNFIQNTTTRQTGNFNVSGNGAVGGGLTVGGNGTGTARVGDLFGGGNYTGISLNNSTNPNDYNFLSSPTEQTLYINRPDGNSIVFRKNNQTQMTLDNDGNLTVAGTINGTATNATNVAGGYVQLPLTSGAPPAADCTDQTRGRMRVDSIDGRLYVCIAAGWKSTTLQ